MGKPKLGIGVLLSLVILAGCYVYRYPAPGPVYYYGASTYDRSWNAAMAAMQDVGVSIVSSDRNSGVHQVLCITHLPQIACFGNAHFSVRKNVQAGRTVTSVNLLDRKERVEEITRMLGGKQVTEKTRAHAIEMLQSAGSKK